VDLEPERAQLVGDERAGRDFLERGFRMRMNVMAPRAHVGFECRDFRNGVHEGFSPALSEGES
jgi:hypothetical protein